MVEARLVSGRLVLAPKGAHAWALDGGAGNPSLDQPKPCRPHPHCKLCQGRPWVAVTARGRQTHSGGAREASGRGALRGQFRDNCRRDGMKPGSLGQLGLNCATKAEARVRSHNLWDFKPTLLFEPGLFSGLDWRCAGQRVSLPALQAEIYKLASSRLIASFIFSDIARFTAITCFADFCGIISTRLCSGVRSLKRPPNRIKRVSQYWSTRL
jgi:hypothetical protein